MMIIIIIIIIIIITAAKQDHVFQRLLGVKYLLRQVASGVFSHFPLFREVKQMASSGN
jgi:hypothetical protein